MATDINRKREVWIDKGPLFDAIRASIAVPMLFAPVRRGHQLLLDGGVLNPLPIAPTLTDDTGLSVAVDAPKDKIICLQTVLRLDPDHRSVHRG